MSTDSADDSKISNRTINTNRISNRTYDSKSNRITKLRRSLVCGYVRVYVRMCKRPAAVACFALVGTVSVQNVVTNALLVIYCTSCISVTEISMVADADGWWCLLSCCFVLLSFMSSCSSSSCQFHLSKPQCFVNPLTRTAVIWVQL